MCIIDMTNRTFIFAGGGTGGHIFPALAIAEQIELLEPTASLVFICSDRPGDAAILSREDRRFLALPAAPFGIRPRALSRLARKWGECVRRSRMLIREEQQADRDVHVISLGGFVSPPVAQAARAERAPVTLVNMDATPGLANRWIARRAQHVVTTYEQPRRATWELIRPIVRADALAPGDAQQCRSLLGLDPARQTLVVMGGSQGAETINAAMIEIARTHAELFANWQVFHLAGDRDRESVESAYESAGVDARVEAFHAEMGQVWGSADLAIARAGAGTVAEAQANSTPTIFMPYPFHRDQHQRLNALRLTDSGGGVIVEDSISASENAGRLFTTVQDLLTDSRKRTAMQESLRSLGPADGAETLARRLLSS